MTEHNATIEIQRTVPYGTVYYRFECSCGRVGAWKDKRHNAQRSLKQHVKLAGNGGGFQNAVSKDSV